MAILSALYGTILSGRSLLYKTGIKKIRRLPVRVISIGNLTLGGTGKTPATIAVAEEALRSGLNPCILTRGYKGKAKGPCLVKVGTKQYAVSSNKTEKSVPTAYSLLLTKEFGDEPLLMAERLKDVPVVKCADRYKGGVFALSSSLVTRPSSLVFILDDGFQHYQLHRDIDILLIDAVNPFGNERLFPEGILREPLSSIGRAQAVVITRADAVPSEIINAVSNRIREYNHNAPIHKAFHKPLCMVSPDWSIREISFINHRKVYAFSGIANPAHFKTMLNSIGAEAIGVESFKDHYFYNQNDIDKIAESAAGMDIITTEKDLVKLMGLRLPKNLFALRVGFSVDKEFYDYVFGRIQC
ncbi:MAG: tetraacyldisaccharide 4'-kinase [Nitrospirae bacterium]|nr:tetraacyldisaccharide 4'-kinase [Nitrospirota bacterium]